MTNGKLILKGIIYDGIVKFNEKNEPIPHLALSWENKPDGLTCKYHLRRDVKFQDPPYTNSLEFLSYIKLATPDSLKYVIEDMFETITLYENKAKEATYSRTEDGKYQVDLTIESKKFRADNLGNETEIPINDWIYITVLGEEKVNGKNKEKQLYLKKHKVIL